MKKFYKIFLWFLILIFLSTFSPNKLTLISEKNSFFEVENIIIENNFLIKKQQIKEKLHKIYNSNILFIKKKDIKKPLQGIDFLEKVEVKKKYPDTIIIKIFETDPIANIFKNKEKYLIDSSSNLILLKNNSNFDKLPKIFGEDAENHFINFLNKLNNNNFPNKKIINYYYFQIGRWDIQLDGNKTIKFPHNNVDEAIRKSIELLNRKDFENYNIIDLRVNGKIIVE